MKHLISVLDTKTGRGAQGVREGNKVVKLIKELSYKMNKDFAVEVTSDPEKVKAFSVHEVPKFHKEI